MRRLATALAAWLLATSMAAAQIVTGSVPNTFVNGTIIDATQVNADYTYIINQVNANAAKNGVNSDITALTALGTPLTPAQSGSNIYYAGAATGTAGAMIVATATPANFTLATGKSIRFLASNTNTGAVTLAVNGTAATNILKTSAGGLMGLVGGEIVAGDLIECYFDGTQFLLISNKWENGGYGPIGVLNNTGTADLGTVGSHFISLANNTSITSFGTPLNTTYPIFLVSADAVGGATIIQSANLSTPTGGNIALAQHDLVLARYWNPGWDILAVYPILGRNKAAPAQANGVYIRNNGATPNTQIDVSATGVVMDNAGGGNYYTPSYGTCTVNLSVGGAGGLDTGVLAANTWYHVYLIGSGSATSCLASTNSNSPTMPGGYTFRVRVGAMETDGASALYRTKQFGRIAQYSLVGGTNTALYRTIISGASGSCGATTTWTGTVVQGVHVPLTAIGANTRLSTGASIAIAAGPTNVPAAFTSQPLASNSVSIALSGYMEFDSASLYYCSNGGASFDVTGWTDQVNAN